MRRAWFFCFLVLWKCASFNQEPGRPPKINGVPIADSERYVYIQNFRNNSYAPGLHTKLTQYVKEEVDRRGRFLQTRDKFKSTYRIYGEIIHYQLIGNLMDQVGNQLSSEMFLVTKLEIQKADTGERLVLERDEIPGTVYFSPQLGYRESEEDAQDRLLRVMSIRIAEESEKAWYFFVRSKTQGGEAQ